jgi:hypothetical protein
MSTTNGNRPRFTLERFAWTAPDRLEVCGSFRELGDRPIGAPVLHLRASDRTYELPAIADGLAGPHEQGGRWRATFAWLEPPVWFEAAELRLGGDLLVELPQPGALEEPGPVDQVEHAGDAGLERLRLQAGLVAAQEDVRAARAMQEQLGEELRRAHADLEAERRRHASDADRFLDSLARVRQSAEEAAASERAVVVRLERELAEARAELEALRSVDRIVAEVRGPAAGLRAAAQDLVRQLASLEHALDAGQ